MAVSYKGITIKFGGDTSELQGALKSIQTEARKTNGDLKDINKALKLDPGNTTLLEQKVKALNSAYDETKQKLDAYKQGLAQLEAKKQSGAQLTAQEERQYDSLQRAILQTEHALEGYADELKSAQREAGASKTSLYQLGQTMEDNADKAGKAGKGMETAGKAISGGVIAAATGLSALADSQEESIAQTNQLETAFRSAGETTEQAQSVYASFYRLLGEGDTATEASQNLARLTTNQQELEQWTNIAAGAYATFGDALPLENLAEASQETAHTGTVTGGLADALNWSTASAEQWSAALSGHAEAQAAFNQSVADSGTKEDAFNSALAACGDEQERASLITETLNGLYGETGEQFQETNGDLLAARDAQNEMNTAMADLGEAALPVKQVVMELGAELLQNLAPALESVTGWYKGLSPEQQTLVTNLALGAVAFGGVTTAVGKTLQSFESIGGAFKTASTAFEGVKGVMGSMGFLGTVKDGFAGIATKAGGLAGTLGGKLSTGWTSFTGLIAANPILLGVAAVAAAAAGLTWFFTQTETGKQMWSDFTGWISEKWQGVQDFFSGVPEFWGGIWDGCKQKVDEFKQGVGQKWDELKTNASNTWENIKTSAGTAWDNMTGAAGTAWDNIKTAAADKWNGVKENVGNAVDAAKQNAANTWDNMTSAAGTAWDNIKAAAADKWNGVKDNIKSNLDTARTVGSESSSALKSLLNGNWDGAKTHAASAFNAIRDNVRDRMQDAKDRAVSLANSIGDRLGFPGLGNKVYSVFRNAANNITSPINDAWNTISGIPGRITSAFSGIRISLPHISLPHFSVSWRDIGGVVKLPSIGVNWYAKGGFFTGPTIAGLGEKGNEYALPEDRITDLMATAIEKAQGAAQQVISVSVSVNATIAEGADAYETGRRIGDGIASRLKQRGVSFAT